MVGSRLDDNLDAELAEHERTSGLHGIVHTTVNTKFATDGTPHHDYAQAIGQVYDLLTDALPEHLTRIMELYEEGEYQQAADLCGLMRSRASDLEYQVLEASRALGQAKT